MPLLTRLSFQDWQQIEQVDVKLGEKLTVLTGANGSGKSTILRIVGRHLNWNYNSLGVPSKRHRGRWKAPSTRGPDSDKTAAEWITIGRLHYSNDSNADIRIPAVPPQAQYQPQVDRQQQVPGVYLPSDRPEFSYAPVQQIPVKPQHAQDAFNAIDNSLRQIALSQGGHQSFMLQMKGILVGLAVFGFGNDAVEPDDDARALFEGYQAALHRVFPSEIGFRKLVIRNYEIVLDTDSGSFLLDAVSGGVGALTTLCWLLYMYSVSHPGPFMVVIDEPENHLHPRMQRELLPAFIDTFPQARFLVATHSPLIVGSVKGASIYALVFNEERRVVSQRLDMSQTSGSASEVLQRALDLPTTYPVWVEEAYESILSRHLSEPLNAETSQRLKDELTNAGLADHFYNALLAREKKATDR